MMLVLSTELSNLVRGLLITWVQLCTHIAIEYKKNIFDHYTLKSYNIKYIIRTVKTWLLSEFV